MALFFNILFGLFVLILISISFNGVFALGKMLNLVKVSTSFNLGVNELVDDSSLQNWYAGPLGAFCPRLGFENIY